MGITMVKTVTERSRDHPTPTAGHVRGGGVEKALIRNSSVPMKAVAKVILGLNICVFSLLLPWCFEPHLKLTLVFCRYRHQLNHTPKQIYACDFPDCTRSFVRLDLCNRHKDRHTAKGSALNRKDSMISHISPITDRPKYVPQGSMSPEANRPGSGYPQVRPAHIQYQSPKDPQRSPYTPITNTPPTGFPTTVHPNGVDGFVHQDASYGGMPGNRQPHHSPHGSSRPTVQTNVGHYGVLSPVSTQHGYHSQHSNTPQSGPYVTQQNFPPFNLPPSDFTNGTATTPAEAGGPYIPSTSAEYPEQGHPSQSSEMMLLDQMSMPGTIPVFGSESILNKSPFVSIPEDFVAYLFNTHQGDGSQMTPVMAPQQSK
jgi:hypothetical protein